MKFGTPGCAGGGCAPRAYELQLDLYRDADEVLRMSDGFRFATVMGLCEELNRLAEENVKLREERDEKLRAAEKQLEQLRIQLSTKVAEEKGQGMLWPGGQY